MTAYRIEMATFLSGFTSALIDKYVTFLIVDRIVPLASYIIDQYLTNKKNLYP